MKKRSFVLICLVFLVLFTFNVFAQDECEDFKVLNHENVKIGTLKQIGNKWLYERKTSEYQEIKDSSAVIEISGTEGSNIYMGILDRKNCVVKHIRYAKVPYKINDIDNIFNTHRDDIFILVTDQNTGAYINSLFANIFAVIEMEKIPESIEYSLFPSLLNYNSGILAINMKRCTSDELLKLLAKKNCEDINEKTRVCTMRDTTNGKYHLLITRNDRNADVELMELSITHEKQKSLLGFEYTSRSLVYGDLITTYPGNNCYAFTLKNPEKYKEGIIKLTAR